MLDYINQIIGFAYEDNPIVYILCFFVLIWFIYQFFTFLYVVFGVHK